MDSPAFQSDGEEVGKKTIVRLQACQVEPVPVMFVSVERCYGNNQRRETAQGRQWLLDRRICFG